MRKLLAFAVLVSTFVFEVYSQQPSVTPIPPRADWKIFPVEEMPSGEPITETEAAKLANGGYAGRVLYLTGNFVVTAAATDRVVLRSEANPGSIRIVAVYPPSITTPTEGARIVRDKTRGFPITDIRRGGDGQVTIYVRDITRP